MNLIVISNATTTPAEIDVVISLFRDGLEHFHLRKPKASRKQLEAYLEQIPSEFRNRIVLHSHHKLAGKYQLGGIHLGKRHRKKTMRNWWRKRSLRLLLPNMVITRSFHRLSRLLDNELTYSYVFLSPVFEGISKKQHSAGYSVRRLSRILPKHKDDVIALGGIDESKVQQVIEMGFSGMALWGALWEKKGEELATYRAIKDAITVAMRARSPQANTTNQLLNE